MSFTGHLINITVSDHIPFYSQIVLTSSSFHNDAHDVNFDFTYKFVFKSLDPLINKSDIKNIIINSNALSSYFNIEVKDINVVQKGDNIYHFEARINDLTLPKVIYVNYVPLAYSNPDQYLNNSKSQTIVKPEVLQKMCDEYMAKYDLQNALNKKLKQKVVTDEEGFQLVTSGPLPVKASELKLKKKKT